MVHKTASLIGGGKNLILIVVRFSCAMFFPVHGAVKLLRNLVMKSFVMLVSG
jgi:hypothetical protein